jgi:predicted permease
LAAAAILCDAAVVAAAVKASLKLMLLCGAVAALQARGSLPAETSRVLSQVAFNLTIPCMLATTTARTLASTTDPAQLVAVPLVALFHVATGALLGKWASAAVEGRCPVSRALFGWGPLLAAPAASREARAAAEATARAVGVTPLAAEALLPPAAATSDGAAANNNNANSAAAALAGRPPNSEAIVRLACAFANVFTLPLLYLATLIPAGSPDLAAATAYVALYHAAWSPLLWTYGYSKLLLGGMANSRVSRTTSSGSGAGGLGAGGKTATFSASEEEGRRRREAEAELRRRRGAGVLGRVGSPSGGGLVLPAEIVGGTGPSSSPETNNATTTNTTTTNTTTTTKNDDDDGATPAEALVRALWSASAPLRASIGPLRASIAKLLTPPVAAVLVGLVLGGTDLGKAIIGLGGGGAKVAAAVAAAASSSSSSPVAALLAWDASVILGLLRCCWDVAETLATATLALQAIVLASSLFGGAGTAGASATAGAGPAVAAGAGAGAAASSAASSSATTDVVDIEQFASPSPSTSSAEEDEREHEAAGLPRSPLRQQREKAAAAAASSSPPSAADAAGASLLSQLRPRGAWEWRVLLAVGAVRFLIVPAISVAVLLWLRSSGLAPLPAGKACMLALLLPSIAPPGQNLALVVQLSPSTSALTAPMSRLLLQLYALAVLPVTLWVAAVVSWL